MIYLDDVFGSYPQGIKVGKKNAINSLALSWSLAKRNKSVGINGQIKAEMCCCIRRDNSVVVRVSYRSGDQWPYGSVDKLIWKTLFSTFFIQSVSDPGNLLGNKFPNKTCPSWCLPCSSSHCWLNWPLMGDTTWNRLSLWLTASQRPKQGPCIKADGTSEINQVNRQASSGLFIGD
jgi:hypothetical protein